MGRLDEADVAFVEQILEGRPRFRYSLDTLTTKLRFDSISSLSDARSPRLTPSASAISSSFVRRGYSRISVKYRDKTELRSFADVSIYISSLGRTSENTGLERLDTRDRSP
jgi:hypothetical protein